MCSVLVVRCSLLRSKMGQHRVRREEHLASFRANELVTDPETFVHTREEGFFWGERGGNTEHNKMFGDVM